MPPCWPPSTITVTTTVGVSAGPKAANQAWSFSFWFSAEPVLAAIGMRYGGLAKA